MECPVCLTESANTKLHCGHSFCFPCLKQWLVKTVADTPCCPMCRATIRFKGLKKIEEDLEEKRYDEQYMAVFDELITEAIESYMDFVQEMPFMKGLYRPLMNELKNIESTFNSMKNLYSSHPETIAEEMIDYGLELNYKKENRRLTRDQWQGRDKFATKHNRTRVKNSHR